MMHFKILTLGKSARMIVGFTAALAISSCEMKKNLDEMHDATMDMSETTTKMEKSTSAMKDLTTELRDSTVQVQAQTAEVGATSNRLETTTNEMYDAIKQGDSLAARRNGLKSIEEASDSARKLSEAAKYFMSFEFQLWSSMGQDTHERREELLASAAKEFMRDVQEFVQPNQTKPNPSADPESILSFDPEAAADNMNLNALAAAMHMINAKQTENIKKHPGNNEVSMYSIIKDALIASQQIASGKKSLRDFPPHVREVLAHERVAVLLMQVRYNYFACMALAKTTKIRNSSARKLMMLTMSWKLDVSQVGVTELDESAKYLEGSLKAFDFMRSVGIKPEMDGKLRRILKNMRLSPALEAEVATVRARTAAVKSRQAAAPKVTPHAVVATSVAELLRYVYLTSSDLKLTLPTNARNTNVSPLPVAKH